MPTLLLSCLYLEGRAEIVMDSKLQMPSSKHSSPEVKTTWRGSATLQQAHQLLPVPKHRTVCVSTLRYKQEFVLLREGSKINQSRQLNFHSYLETKLYPKLLETLVNTKNGHKTLAF